MTNKIQLIHSKKLFFFLLILTIFPLVYSQQPYERHLSPFCDDSYNSSHLGYFCNGMSKNASCRPNSCVSNSCISYLTFHPTSPYNTVTSISSLLNVDASLLSQSNLNSNSMLVIPVSCSCSKDKYQYNVTYTVPSDNTNAFIIASSTFQALTTCQAIVSQNSISVNNSTLGQNYTIPLRCACPTTRQYYNYGIRHLLTYLVNYGDNLSLIGQIFGIDSDSIADANELSVDDILYPSSTLLVPLKTKPNFTQISVRPPPPPSPSPQPSPPSRTKHVAVMVISIFGAFLFIFVGVACFWRIQQWKKISTSSREKEDNSLECDASGDCRMFVLSELKSSTYNFSDEYKLGEGGFGSVYKGALPDQKEIAVKRLAGWSKQGFLEFKNEVELLAKLKHKNLVKLLGYCLEKNEKLLCYEYLPCGSLDRILFASDEIKRDKLSWQTRYNIIEGISSGLRYLHQESGVKIVHRDLKPSNILLDEHMNPKISDFGLARLYKDDQTHKETSIIAGTYGYMAPEYAMHGVYSEKLDIYSFGVLLLEIVTGRKASSFGDNHLAPNIISYAWQHWAKEEVEVLKDPALDHVSLNELSRCIHIGLLCVQQNPINRPNMDGVNVMLQNESIPIPALPMHMSRMGFSIIEDSISISSNDDMPNVSLPLGPSSHVDSPSISDISSVLVPLGPTCLDDSPISSVGATRKSPSTIYRGN